MSTIQTSTYRRQRDHFEPQDADPLPMSMSAVVQHLKVLEASGLVVTEKVGRVRTCRVEPQALSAAERWINERRRTVESSLDRLGLYLDETRPGKETGE